MEISEDLLKKFEKCKKAKEFFESLSFTHKKEYIHWINEAKKQETRKRRLFKKRNKNKIIKL